ncbi:hypothetical protein FQZ97_1152620 [compost metagenome]
MFGGVLAVDHQPRLLIGEGVHAHGTASLIAARRGTQPAAIGGNATVGVAGLFGADRGEALAQLSGLIWRNGGLGGRDHGERQCADHQGFNKGHL